jgi:DNA-directed RNA polymerase specialized sigma24 family protein
MNLDELAAAALAGDRRAMEELACFLDRGLRLYFRRRWPHDVADDLVQRTFEATLTKKHRFDPRGESSFVRWVHGIASLEHRSMRREKQRLAQVMGELGKVDRIPARGLSSFILLMETAGMVDDEVKQLSPAQRQAVEKFLDKARGEDRSPNHPAINLYRAREKLKRRLTERMSNSVSPPKPAAPKLGTPPAT